MNAVTRNIPSGIELTTVITNIYFITLVHNIYTVMFSMTVASFYELQAHYYFNVKFHFCKILKKKIVQIQNTHTPNVLKKKNL